MRLAAVEADVGVQKSVAAVIKLAAVKLGPVVQALINALETLIKVGSSSASAPY